MDPLRVLVVEDNPVNRLLATKSVEKLGHKVESAANGVEALQRLREARFDIVLMDCEMPQMNGYEASSLIRSGTSGVLDSTIPIIALTGHDLPEDLERCTAAGMTSHLSKPFRFDDLAGAIAHSRKSET